MPSPGDIGIDLQNVTVRFPIYNARSRSIRHSVIRTVGGPLSRAGRQHVEVEALRNVSIRLRPGDRLGLAGHNGAGKSTLLRVLAGAYEPCEGTASIRGRVASLLDIGLGLEPELTGRENIELRAACLGLSKRQTSELQPWIADFCELGSFLDLPLRTYSAGMSLRLAFAISTAARADILLLDEMITVGDQSFAEKARAHMQTLMHRASILVIASHDDEVLHRWCNRFVRLDKGQIESYTQPD